MRHGHHRAVPAAQRLGERVQRGGVQVVGRLVQQQHVHRPEHEGGERDARLLAAGQVSDRAVDRGVPGEAQRAQNRARGLRRDRRVGGARDSQHVRERCIVARQLLREVLREVPHAHALAVPERTFPAPDRARQRAQQRGLPGAVRAHHQHALAALRDERGVREQGRRAGVVSDLGVFQYQSLLRARRRIRESQSHALHVSRARDVVFVDGAAGGIFEQPFEGLAHAHELLRATLRCRRRARARAVFRDKGFELLRLFRLLGGGCGGDFPPLGALREEPRVVAAVPVQTRGAHLHQAVYASVEQLLVVRHDERRALVPPEPAAQVLLRARVQVVGGLVQEQEPAGDALLSGVPRGAQQQPRERDAHLPPPAQRRARPVPGLAREAEAGEHVRHAAFHRVAAHGFPPLLSGEERALRALGAGGYARLGVPQRALGVAHVRHPRARLPRHRQRRAGDGGLLEVPHLRALRHEQRARVHVPRAAHRAEQRGLPAPVRAHQAHHLAGLDAQIRAHQQVPVANGHAHVAKDHHRARGVPARHVVRLGGGIHRGIGRRRTRGRGARGAARRAGNARRVSPADVARGARRDSRGGGVHRRTAGVYADAVRAFPYRLSRCVWR